MRGLCLPLILAWLLTPCTTLAQEAGEWEIPDNLKGNIGKPTCPEGKEQNAQGQCVDKKVPESPLPPPPPLAPVLETRPEPKPEPKPVERAPLTPPAQKEAPPPEKTPPAEKPAEAQPTPVPEKAAVTPKEEEKPPAKAFIKGELANFIGSTKLVTKNNRIGVCLGYRYFDLIHYATISPEADLRFGDLEFGLGVPLSFEVFNGKWPAGMTEPIGFGNAGSIREEDWNEPGEYVRFIRYLTWGKKEDRLFFNLSQVDSTTVGHGALMRRYSVNIDPDSTRVSGELDAYNDYAGFEFVGNSVIDWDLFGGIGFVKPLSFFSDNTMARSFSIGFTYMADRHAPVAVKTDPGNPLMIVGTGRPEVTSDAFLHGMGIDAEIKVLKTDNLDLKPFIDFSWLMPGKPSGAVTDEPEGGNGLTVGVLGRFNFGSDPVHALRTIVELRTFSATYLPGYFDTFYEVQKFIANPRYGTYAPNLPPTKFRDVFIDRKTQDRKLGFYLEFNYALVDALALTLSLEGSNAPGGNRFLAHLEVPALSWLQFFGSFHQAGMEELGDLFSKAGSDKILFAAARLRLLPFLFANFRYHYTLILKQDQAVTRRYYEAVHGWVTDFELGWEF